MRGFFFVLPLILGVCCLIPTKTHAMMEDYPSVKLQGLDKSIGRTITFEAKVGTTIQYGPLYIKIQACRKAPPIETPESAAFLQIWEVPPGEENSAWVFSGWMFASSPALSAMDHPVYDVWVLDCLGKEEPNEEAQNAQTDEQVNQDNLESVLESITGEKTQTPVEGEATPTSEDVEETPLIEQDDPQSPAAGATSATPPDEGIYSPSQGRVVPFSPSLPDPRDESPALNPIY